MKQYEELQNRQAQKAVNVKRIITFCMLELDSVRVETFVDWIYLCGEVLWTLRPCNRKNPMTSRSKGP